MAFQLTSKAFSNGSPIPRKHTCDGEDVSPELTWIDPPQGTRSLALICDDPDARLERGFTGCCGVSVGKRVLCERAWARRYPSQGDSRRV